MSKILTREERDNQTFELKRALGRLLNCEEQLATLTEELNDRTMLAQNLIDELIAAKNELYQLRKNKEQH